MKLQRALPLLMIALLATPALGQESTEQQIETPPRATLTGFVSIEAEPANRRTGKG